MYVTAKPIEALRMYGNVAQDKSIHHMVATDISKVTGVVTQLEDIVVTFDQDLVSVEPI
jgi:hypothetical protein